MAFRVQEFRSQLTGDGARPNLFRCVINFPTLALASSPQTGFASAASAAQKLTFFFPELDGSTPKTIRLYGMDFAVPQPIEVRTISQ